MLKLAYLKKSTNEELHKVWSLQQLCQETIWFWFTSFILLAATTEKATMIYLWHKRFKKAVVGLADHPVGVSAQRPAGYWSDQSLLVWETADEVGDEFRKMWDHATHAALGDGAQHQDTGLLHLPINVEQCLFQDWKQDRKNLLVEHVGQDIKGCGRTLSCNTVILTTTADLTSPTIAC